MSGYGRGSARGRPYRGGRESDRRSDAPASNPRKRPAADDLNEAWLADEDRFMLQQQKKKAEFRISRGNPKPIDWLAIGLRFIDPSRKPAEDEVDDTDLDFVSPEDVFEGLSAAQLDELAADIKLFLPFETVETNKAFWETMTVACQDRRHPPEVVGRNFDNVSKSVHKMLGDRSLEKLIELEQGIANKLENEQGVDVEFYVSTVNALKSYKARIMLQDASKKVVDARSERLKALGQVPSQQAGAELQSTDAKSTDVQSTDAKATDVKSTDVKSTDVKSTDDQSAKNGSTGVQAAKNQSASVQSADGPKVKRLKTDADSSSSKRPETLKTASAATQAQYDREVARGLGENEEVFANEVPVSTVGLAKWQDEHRPRKPLYFNRVHMGFEWNKYNQSHYTTDDPPPKKPQGYRFVLFLPEKVDHSKTPQYKIEREGGRKRGEILAPAGEDDMCIIRFMPGPPYEDIAFRIVDREWDYSAKQRGFKAEWRDGVLEVSFFFKKVRPYFP